MSLLESLSIDKYGTVRAVRDLSLEVQDGELVALLGSNGAGKTTTLKAIMGLVPATDASDSPASTSELVVERIVRAE
jgi:ABC-type multidrug transport system ATPase subunit